MPCYHPLSGYMGQSLSAEGKRAWKFSKSKKLVDPVKVPCGRCIGCYLERSRQWAVRCVHEAQLHRENCFVTLTYNDEHLPKTGSLVKSHFQNFMKALRPRVSHPVSYFMCGEYGDDNQRPHYHAILFGVDFPDKVKHSERKGCVLYTSGVLSKLWTRGFSTIGAVTLESAAYCARYTMKKVSDRPQAKRRTEQVIDPVTGELLTRVPEYVQMSLKRPIGKEWLTAYKSDVYPCDFVVVGGARMKPPRYYDKQLSQTEAVSIKEIRRALAVASPDNTPARLEAREEVKRAQIKQLQRRL